MTLATEHQTPHLTSVAAADLMGALEDWGPRVPADSGTPQTSGRIIHRAPDASIEIGIWECTPGSWTITDRVDNETIHLLAGRARLTDAGGSSVDLVAGDVLVLPRGWSGTWEIVETVRKFYVIARDAAT